MMHLLQVRRVGMCRLTGRRIGVGVRLHDRHALTTVNPQHCILYSPIFYRKSYPPERRRELIIQVIWH